MDFEDSGIESDPKINNDANTLKQNTEPIISFSPERCRFDSITSNFRKPSTSFSVTDLQAEDPLEIQQPLAKRTNPSSSSNANDCNSIANLKNSSTPTTTVPSNLPLAQGDYHRGLITHHHHQNSHIFLQNDTPQLPIPSNLSSTPVGGSLVINTYSPTTTTLKSVSSTTNSSGSSKPPVLATTTCVDSNPISLMINGSVLSANSTTNSTSDLQKRLEKRIAQASAAVATSSNSQPTGKTKASESILQNILSSSSSPPSIDGGAPNSNALIIPSSDSSSADNQISFSPQNSVKSHSAFQQKLPASLWESGSSASDIELLWESKLCSSKQNEEASKVIPDPFIESPQEIQVSQLQSEAQAKETENESNRDERNEVAKSTFISNNTCNNHHHPITDPASTLNNAGTGDIFVSCSNNNDITPNVNKSWGESRANLRNNNNASNMTSSVPASAATSTSTVVVVNTGFDIRKVSALLPPQRLAIPCKPNPQLQSSHSTACNAKTGDGRASSTNSPNSTETTNVTFSSRSSNPTGSNPNNTNPSVANVHKTSSRKASSSETSNIRDGDGNVPCGNGNVKAGSTSSKLSSEKKPLVQWDSDESEEELSFFPPSKRGVITDNLSIDNMSLSGEEEDLHLTPPRPLAKRCPCDPRAWIDRRRISSHHHQHGDSIRNIVSKPCVIS